jgi:hypothetical protein
MRSGPSLEVESQKYRTLGALVCDLREGNESAHRSSALDHRRHASACMSSTFRGDWTTTSVRSDKDGGLNHIRLYRYAFHNASFSRDDLIKLQFDRFTNDSKVEFHGCKTAEKSKLRGQHRRRLFQTFLPGWQDQIRRGGTYGQRLSRRQWRREN